MIEKINNAVRNSDNLASSGGVFRFIGTRYHYNDPYSELMRRGIVQPRVKPCTLDSSDDFQPANCAFMTLGDLEK